jgi:type III restriction enzyme
VDLERKPMGEGTDAKTPIVVEVDVLNDKKNLDELDIEIPVMTARVFREYKNLDDMDVAALSFQPVMYHEFSKEEQREIVFKDITTGEITHTTILDTAGVADCGSVIGYFAQTIMKDLRLVSGYNVLYGKVKAFVRDHLFSTHIELDSPNTIRNLSEMAATKTVIETLKKAINDLTVKDKGDAEIRDTIKLRQVRPFVAKNQKYVVPKKSIFNRIIGDSNLELRFATFLEQCDDVTSFAKNYMAVNFKLDYVRTNGEISNYYPDFLVKLPGNKVTVVETKGLEDLDVPEKMRRLAQWVSDLNKKQDAVEYSFVFVDEEGFNRYQPKSFQELVQNFRQYQSAVFEI